MHEKSLILSNRASDSLIVTADSYLKSLQLCLGGDGEACGLIAKDWDVLIKEAEERLTWTDPQGLIGNKSAGGALSKDSILDFEAIITSTRKDRDGDILETGGAEIDPACALLMFHDPNLPVGKMLAKTRHTKDLMSGRFCILNTQLGRDAKTLVEGGALRISHGFEPLEFEPMEKGGRWHITKLQIMEVSLVSVPSNVDAVILNFENGKLHSPLMKSWGKSLFDNRKVIVKAGWPVSDEVKEKALELIEKHNCSCHQKDKVVINQSRLQEHKDKFDDPLRWNRKLSKNFDVAQEYLQASTLEYEWVGKFLSCQIKDIFQNSTVIGSARMGSWLMGLRNILGQKGALQKDLRNITYEGKERPPVHEVIQLNSKQSEDFLIEGVRFFESKEGNFVLKTSPSWYGINVTVYTTTKQKQLNRDIIEKTWVWAKENNYLKGEAFSISGEFLPRTGETFEDIFLTDKNDKPLQRMVRQLNEKGVKCANRGMIFMGPPGTGKTLSGRAIKNMANASFIWISARDFYRLGAYSGLADAFDMAKEIAPTVLFFEDIDNWITEGTIDLLKTEMDGIGRSSGVITILTTNFPQNLPEALIDRPGRFHDVLKFDLPTAKERERMLSKWLEGIDEETITSAVEKTNGLSGAHLYELAAFAKTISEQDEIPLSESIFKALEKITEQRELINDAQLSGSRFKPRRDFVLSRKDLKMDSKDNNDAEFPTQGETVDKPGDLEAFGGMASQQGDTGFVPQEASEDKPGTAAEAGQSDATGDVSSGNGVGKGVVTPDEARALIGATKSGRSISAKNRERLTDAKDHLDDVLGMDKTKISSSAKTLVKAAHAHIAEICNEPDDDDKGIPESVGFELDPAMYDVSKLHELKKEQIFELVTKAENFIAEAEKQLEQIANEEVAEHFAAM